MLYRLLVEGRLPAREVIRRGADAGISQRTLQRAKDLMGVESEHEGFGPGSKFYWVLPQNSEIVERLRSRNLSELCERLFGGTDLLDDEAERADGDDPLMRRMHQPPPLPGNGEGDEEEDDVDPADWWKQGGNDDRDEGLGDGAPC